MSPCVTLKLDSDATEDASLSRRRRAPEVLGTLNNTLLGLLAPLDGQNVAAALRTTTFHIERALASIALQLP